MKLDLHYTDPRLVELYDIDNPRGVDTDFYIQLATEIEAQTILDLGCGTGLLTRELAVNGHNVIGVDPSPAMLAYARRQPDADLVQWIESDASFLGTPEADLTIMTGNVAQVFLDDSDWLATLRAIHEALRPGGYIAFESRNPEARAWENWNRKTTYEQINSPHGPMECWLELISVTDGRVRFEAHNIFNDTSEVLVVSSELRFRSLAELTDSLKSVGFSIVHVYGGWHHEPVTKISRIMVFVAQHT
jgi:SAM-dependent methyltransferase